MYFDGFQNTEKMIWSYKDTEHYHTKIIWLLQSFELFRFISQNKLTKFLN